MVTHREASAEFSMNLFLVNLTAGQVLALFPCMPEPFPVHIPPPFPIKTIALD